MTPYNRRNRQRTHCPVNTYKFSQYGTLCDLKTKFGRHEGDHKFTSRKGEIHYAKNN